MSVCPVDENGYCSRHQKVHYGRLLEISQMDNEFGESYRRLWDGDAAPLVVRRHVLPRAPVCRKGES